MDQKPAPRGAASVPIDWNATAAPFPEILIQRFDFEVPGIVGTLTAGFGLSRSSSRWG